MPIRVDIGLDSGGDVVRHGRGRDGRIDFALDPRGARREGDFVADGRLDGEEADVLDTQEIQDEPQVGLDEVGRGEGTASDVPARAEGAEDVGPTLGDEAGEARTVEGEGVADTHDVVDPRLEGRGK